MAEEASGWLKEGQKIEVFENVKNCVTEADLVVTATFAPRPVLKSGLKSMLYTVWIFQNFSTVRILREIRESRVSKMLKSRLHI